MKIRGRKRVFGDIEVLGDKSISHRAVILGSIAKGETNIENILLSEDTLNTIEILKKIGANITVDMETRKVTIQGGKLKPSKESLYCGNSGTTIRLLSGLLVGQDFDSLLTGDDSLSNRPMSRIIEPLSLMGAKIHGNNKGHCPIKIKGNTTLSPINYTLPIASAQVKSAILFASLYTKGKTTIIENKVTRDHTERMLKYFGASIYKGNSTITIQNPCELKGKDIYVPGDISSAAYFIVAASIVEGSSITIKNVGINPSRTGIITVLQAMGGDIQIDNTRELNNEPIGDIVVNYKALQGIEINPDIIGTLIDEIPIIAVAACFAKGDTIIRNASELRYKETDRISAITKELNEMGANVESLPDGLIIHGVEALKASTVNSHKDHRIAMSLAIAALNSTGTTEILNADCIDVSYPNFTRDLGTIVDYSFDLN